MENLKNNDASCGSCSVQDDFKENENKKAENKAITAADNNGITAAVIPNDLPESCAASLEVEKRLNRLGCKVITPKGGEFPHNSTDRLFKEADFVIALGGDGTIIHTAKRASAFKKAVLGINCGHLGFMAGIESDELSKLDYLIENFESCFQNSDIFQRRMMLNFHVKTLNGEEKEFTALNEGVISREATAKMASFSVNSKREPVISYHADGIIVATPTGSTAYSLSAGGPIIDPDVECLLVTPICAHSLIARSYIFASKDILTLEIMSPESEPPCRLSVDGVEGMPIGRGDIITVTRSRYYANMIMMSDKPFYGILNQKLINRR